MYCRRCGRQIPDTAKFCPGCGNPTGTNYDTNYQPRYTYTTPKKPYYKKWWFWLLMLLASPIYIPILEDIGALLYDMLLAFIDGFIKGYNGAL